MINFFKTRYDQVGFELSTSHYEIHWQLTPKMMSSLCIYTIIVLGTRKLYEYTNANTRLLSDWLSHRTLITINVQWTLVATFPLIFRNITEFFWRITEEHLTVMCSLHYISSGGAQGLTRYKLCWQAVRVCGGQVRWCTFPVSQRSQDSSELQRRNGVHTDRQTNLHSKTNW